MGGVRDELKSTLADLVKDDLRPELAPCDCAANDRRWPEGWMTHPCPAVDGKTAAHSVRYHGSKAGMRSQRPLPDWFPNAELIERNWSQVVDTERARATLAPGDRPAFGSLVLRALRYLLDERTGVDARPDD